MISNWHEVNFTCCKATPGQMYVLPAQLLLSCPTLWDSMDCSLPGSSIHGIFHARILEWIALPSSRDLPDPGIEPKSLMSAALTGGFLTTTTTWEAQRSTIPCLIKDVCYRLTEKWIFVVHPILSWTIVNLQCCISFKYIAKWFSYT